MWKLITAIALATWLGHAQANQGTDSSDVHIESLSQLSVDSLRQRNYQTSVTLLQPLELPESDRDTFMLGYLSDGLKLYSRLDLPSSPAPEAGYPVLVFAPGWIARADTATWDFGASDGSFTHRTIEAFVARGFAVVTVGYRGRGTVAGVPAQGMAFRDAWGNGSYLSPIFYSIDVLNLISGIDQLNQLTWGDPVGRRLPVSKFDMGRVALLGHSQGGDVALNTLAVLSGNKRFPQKLVGASIWSGNIPDRFTQANTFGPMGSSLQAFMSGDGSWTGTATGSDGSHNPDFVYPWPADWIGTLDTQSSDWTWQAETWSTPTVAEALQKKYGEMYTTLNRYVRNMSDLEFSLVRNEAGGTTVSHAPDVARLMPTIGGFHYPQHLTTPLLLHISDRDYYSIPAWNTDLAKRINAHGGQARVYIYPGNTHSLTLSDKRWFSPEGSVAGASLALNRDIKLFLGDGHKAPN